MKPHSSMVTIIRLQPALAALCFCTHALALPLDGQVVSGAAAISTSGNTMTVQQSAPRAIINWRGFDVGAAEAVVFNQRLRSDIVFNRVTGQQASQIMGSVKANGQIFLSNPNGILFGPAAQVNAGGLVASTGALSDEDFNAGLYNFSGDGIRSSVINQGLLSAADRGYIALLAPQVINQGIITARLGTALLAAGEQITLDIDAGSLLGYNIKRGALDALVDNRQLIKADGGNVFMAAKAADRLRSAVVNNDGVVEALTVQDQAGAIRLLGDMESGHISGNGRLDASAPGGGNGGAIETSAAHVELGPAAQVSAAAPAGKAGHWLIDPTDFFLTVDSSTQGGSGVTVMNALLNTDVTISTLGAGNGSGVITVDGRLAWGRGNTLTLIAATDIVLRPNTLMQMGLSEEAQGNLVLKSGFGGSGKGSIIFGAGATINSCCVDFSSFGKVTVYYNPTSYLTPENFSDRITTTWPEQLTTWMLVNNAAQLQAMNANAATLAGNYALSANISAAITGSWSNGAGLAPIGSASLPFTGRFDGMGNTITGLTINRPGGAFGTGIGLFGTLRNADIRNLGLLDVSITGGGGDTGALAGRVINAAISNSYVSGASRVTGDSGRSTGGLVGFSSGTIERAYSDATVSGGNSTGGLAGLNNGSITQSYSTGTVTGRDSVGGLVGANAGLIDTTYSTASVIGQKEVGGLLGLGAGAAPANPARLKNSYSQNTVRGNSNVGALVGSVAGNNVLDNLVWDSTLSPLLRGAGETTGSANTVTNMRSVSSTTMFGGVLGVGLSATDWFAYAGHTTPLLIALLKPVTAVFSPIVNKAYDASPATGDVLRGGISYFNQTGLKDDSADLSKNIFYDLGSSEKLQNAGSYVLTPEVWSNQKGYAIALPQNRPTINLIINPRNVGLIPTAIQKEYDGSTAAGGAVRADNLLPGDTLTATQSLSSADVNLATSDLRTLTVDSGVKIFSGTEDVTSNYFIQRRPLTSSATRITPKAVTIIANDDRRQAGGTPYSGGNGITYRGLVGTQGREVFLGALRYGGTSQGATQAGTYTIIPSGLSAKNYLITYVNGELALRNPVGFSAISRALADAIEDGNAEMERADGFIDALTQVPAAAGPAAGGHGIVPSRQPTLSIIDSGTRLP